jgi:hypothetical protein
MLLGVSVDVKATIKGPGVLVRLAIRKIALCCNSEIYCRIVR